MKNGIFSSKFICTLSLSPSTNKVVTGDSTLELSQLLVIEPVNVFMKDHTNQYQQ